MSLLYLVLLPRNQGVRRFFEQMIFVVMEEPSSIGKTGYATALKVK